MKVFKSYIVEEIRYLQTTQASEISISFCAPNEFYLLLFLKV